MRSVVYPEEAIKECIEGWVRIEYSVLQNGSTSNVVVIESEPPGVFDQAAVNFYLRQTHDPKREDGVPVRVDGITNRMDFKLERYSNPQCEGK